MKKPREKKPWTKRKKAGAILLSLLVVVLVAVLAVGNLVYYWWLYVYIDGKRVQFAIDNRHVEAGQVVFVGDSITDGCDLAHYYPTLHAYNRGISGATTYDLLHHMKLAVYDLQPRLVVLLIGTNDYQRSRTHANEAILANYRLILQGIADNLPETRVLVQSVYPISDGRYHKHYRYGHGHIVALNEGIQALATEYGYTYADVFEVLTVGDEEINADYTKEGLHPNAAGYEVISAYLTPIIEAMLEAS